MKKKKLFVPLFGLGLVVLFFSILRPVAIPTQIVLPNIPQKFQSIEPQKAYTQRKLQTKRAKPNQNTVKFAKALLNNELYVNTRWPAYKIEGQLTWKEDPFHNRTWCTYFHSLDVVGHLVNAYEMDPNPAYLEKAKWMIESWFEANPSPFYQVSRFAWHDMIAANRIVNIMHFLELYPIANDPQFHKTIMKILVRHGNFLANDYFYSFSNNHGIFQDEALIYLAVTHPELKQSSAWLTKAMNRLQMHVDNDITKDGVHKEHSPYYHMLVLKLFKRINEFLLERGIEQKDLGETISKMHTYLAYVTKSDGTFPNVGDSEPAEDTYSEKKEKTLKLFKVFFDANVAFFRNPTDDMYVMFMAQYHSKGHKHGDDLAFILSLGKTDFLVDSGKYSYETNDRWRDYFLSTKAHNTIIVDDKNYEIINENADKSRIENAHSSEKFDYVVASHDLYPGVHIQRTLVYVKTGSFLVFDKITSKKNHQYSQLFQIGKNIQITPRQNSFELLDEKSKQVIELIQLPADISIKMITGNTDPIQGWLSTRWLKKDPITTLVTNASGENAQFKTIINLNKKNPIQNFESIDKSEFLIDYQNGTKETLLIQ